MKSPEAATLENPPLVSLFDLDPAKRSNLMMTRAKNDKNDSKRQDQPIVINNYISPAQPPNHPTNGRNNEPPLPPPRFEQQPAGPAPPLAQPAPALATPRRFGRAMPLAEFATQYGLASPTRRKLEAISIRNVSSLRFLDDVTLSEKAGLDYGEYGEFLAAKEDWAHDGA